MNEAQIQNTLNVLKDVVYFLECCSISGHDAVRLAASIQFAKTLLENAEQEIAKLQQKSE